jgi:dihydrofolate reductase
MGRVIAVEYLSLDGVMEEPSWSEPYFRDDELGQWQNRNLAEADALLLGRVTYEGFKAAWPTMPETGDGFTEKMNTMPKYVATTTLSEAEWNATFLEGPVEDAVAELKAETDQTLLVNGSAQLFDHLGQHDLIDELRLMIFPVLVGAGKRLFTTVTGTSGLRLTSSWITGTGVAVLTYVPEA